MDPLWFMVLAALSASCAFMLPVATAPNAVAFGSGELPIQRMVREGFVSNLIEPGHRPVSLAVTDLAPRLISS